MILTKFFFKEEDILDLLEQCEIDDEKLMGKTTKSRGPKVPSPLLPIKVDSSMDSWFSFHFSDSVNDWCHFKETLWTIELDDIILYLGEASFC